MPRQMIVLFLLVFIAIPAVAEIELDDKGFPKQDMLKAFEPYVGRLVVTSENKATDLFPEPSKMTGEQQGKYILNGTMFQFHSVGEFDGAKSENIFLYGFDRVEKAYCCWYYQQGAVAFKYKIEWADDGQSFKQILLDDNDLDYSIETHVTLDGGKALRWESKVTTNDGQSVIDQTGALTPAPGEVEFPTPKPKAKGDDKLAMYRPYAGQWNSITKGKATQYIEEPYEVEGTWVQHDLLGGDVVFMDGIVKVEGEPYKYQWFYMYDVREEAYVTWFHDSRGVHTKMYGNWSETKKQMTWTLDDAEKHGVMVTIVDDVSDPDEIGFKFKMEADDGSLIMEEIGSATRAKKP